MLYFFLKNIFLDFTTTTHNAHLFTTTIILSYLLWYIGRSNFVRIYTSRYRPSFNASQCCGRWYVYLSTSQSAGNWFSTTMPRVYSTRYLNLWFFFFFVKRVWQSMDDHIIEYLMTVRRIPFILIYVIYFYKTFIWNITAWHVPTYIRRYAVKYI